MHRATGETLTLTPEQTQRAVKLLKRTNDGEIHSPTDVVDSWHDPKTSINRDLKEHTYPRYEDFVSPDAIAGSAGFSNRLEENRIKRVLVNMIEDNFEVQNSPASLAEARRSVLCNHRRPSPMYGSESDRAGRVVRRVLGSAARTLRVAVYAYVGS